MKVFITFDVEKDLHSGNYESIEKGIPLLFEILDRYGIKATLFVPAKLIEKFPDVFKKIKKQGHEIAIHGLNHERFDELSFKQKEIILKASVIIFRKIFNESPKGFRAPQHSIDKQTLMLLYKYNFYYDSSKTPLNLLQLFFFPKKFSLWLKNFFTQRKIYKTSQKIYEIPPSSLLIPFVSLPLRIFPWPVLKIYLFSLAITHEHLVFYAHSWDLIPLPESRIDRLFSHKKFIKNFERTISYLKTKNKFLTISQFKDG